MKTIHWKKEEYIDIGDGFIAIVETRTTMDGLVKKAYIYKGLREDEAVLLTSNLSSNFDEMQLNSLIINALSNRERCENVWKINTMRNKKHSEE